MLLRTAICWTPSPIMMKPPPPNRMVVPSRPRVQTPRIPMCSCHCSTTFPSRMAYSILPAAPTPPPHTHPHTPDSLSPCPPDEKFVTPPPLPRDSGPLLYEVPHHLPFPCPVPDSAVVVASAGPSPKGFHPHPPAPTALSALPSAAVAVLTLLTPTRSLPRSPTCVTAAADCLTVAVAGSLHLPHLLPNAPPPLFSSPSLLRLLWRSPVMRLQRWPPLLLLLPWCVHAQLLR